MDDENNPSSSRVLASPARRPSFLSHQDWSLLVQGFCLSPREAEISILILAGHSEREIAELLAISTHTVHSHLERMYRKLNVHARSDLVMAFFRAYADSRQDRGAGLGTVTTLSP
jgi:DNA-binding CsgD family transcriptional regulator